MKKYNLSIQTILGTIVLNFLWIGTSSSLAQESMIEVMDRLSPSIVTITAENMGIFKSPQASAAIDKKTGRVVVLRNLKTSYAQRVGAGVIITSDGVIVTNLHTIIRSNQIIVELYNGTKLPARLLKIFSSQDLAFIQISSLSPLTPIFIANSDTVQLRDEVYTIGNSSLLKQTLSGGKVIGLGSHKNESSLSGAETDFIQISINLYPGDSGGPLLNNQGQLIGLMVAGQAKKDRSSFAISSNQIIKHYNKYREESIKRK